MTERQRADNADQPAKANIYNTEERKLGDGFRSGDRSFAGEDAAIASSDLVRWGPVIAGIFACFATLITLTVLGLAIGLTSFDVGDRAGPFGVGAGIWGAISMLLAFLVGGYFAGRTALVRGSMSGLLQGGIVWFVTIPLLLYMLSGTLSGLGNAIGGVAGTAAQVAGDVTSGAANAVADDPVAQATVQAGAAGAGDALQATATVIAGQVDEQDVQGAVENAGRAAWGTLLSLGLAAAASLLGGYLGAQPSAIHRRTSA